MIRRKNSNIIAKVFEPYKPETFSSFALPNFREVTAEELLDTIKPVTFDFMPGERFISTDTETFYTGIDNHRLPAAVVRRWIKLKGDKYIPNDFPFCIPICDGTNALVVYDTLQNGFKEFKKLEAILADSSISKIYHNAGFDEHLTANAGVNVRGKVHDTSCISRLVRADAFSHRLLDIAKELEEGVVIFELMLDAYKDAHKITDYRNFPRELMTQYTCADTWNTLYAFKHLRPLIDEYEQVPLYEIESVLGARIAYSMERIGIQVDMAYSKVLIPDLEQEVNVSERAIYDMTGYMFNINSSLQLYDAMCKLGYGSFVHFKDPTDAMLMKGIIKGNPSFDKYELERLDNEGVPLISQIQRYKSSSKLLNTFAIKVFEMPDFENKIHCNFNTMEARTGRFSISVPSMQNMPRRKDDRVRGAFIAPEGYDLYDFDFKSQEAIVLAHYSRAQYLLDMIKEGHDIHVATASIVFTKMLTELVEALSHENDVNPSPEIYRAYKEAKALRNDAKSVGFAITYGAGALKVANMTGKTVAEAKIIIKTYLKRIPEVDVFIKTCNNKAKECGVIRTVLKRRVYTIKNREYACVNYVIQGSSADSTKSRMVIIYKFLKANGYKTRMLLQVHDSLLYMVADDELDKDILGKLKWLQTERELFRVQVSVDVDKCSPSWKDKHPVKVETIKPSDEELARMEVYDVWSEGLFDI